MPQQEIPLHVVDLLPALDRKLMELLRSLSPEEWEKQTVARLWKVKDVVAHMLDGNIRVLSMLRDNYHGQTPSNIKSYQDLVDYLNDLNHDWVKAMKRVSPTMLVQMHHITGPLYCDYYRSLNPHDQATWAVSWAGDSVSPNWKHIAREYTEKFLHQQQIRDAVGKPGIMTREFFYPFIDTFMLGLSQAYRNTPAQDGIAVKVTITSDMGGSWMVVRRDEEWVLEKPGGTGAAAEVLIPPDVAWKLFSKSIRPHDIADQIQFSGNRGLGEIALHMVSVMA